MNVVKTEYGYVSGSTIGDYRSQVAVFRGIPYAAPPLGDLRWKPPRPPASWKGIRECTRFSLIAPQPVMSGISSDLPCSEDNLYLNVLTPAKKTSDRLPVMVWMHGGGYSMGCGNDRIWNSARLPQKGVVLVTVNTRLGVFGLLAHPLLTAESENAGSGNYLFLDLIAALKWIKNNIAAFGGNPDNITLFGESGGGGKVTQMMASPLARGLFHRAICESGTAMGGVFGSKTLKEMEARGEEVFARLGLDRSADPLREARKLPWEKIFEASQAVESTVKPSAGGLKILWDAAVDGWYLPQKPEEILMAGRHNAVPLITCANLGEITGPGILVMPWLITLYVQMLTGNRKAGAPGYACIFDQIPANWKETGCVSVHSMELPYVFGDWDNSTAWWTSVYMLALASGAKNDDPGLTEKDRTVSEAMMKMWTTFAAKGDPNSESTPVWPLYGPDDKYLYIGSKTEAKSGFSKLALSKQA